MPDLLHTIYTADPGSAELLNAIEDAEDLDLDMGAVDKILDWREEQIAEEQVARKQQWTFRLWEGPVFVGEEQEWPTYNTQVTSIDKEPEMKTELLRKILRQVGAKWFLSPVRKRDLSLMRDAVLRDMFTFPEAVKRIELTLHSCPGVDRLMAEVNGDYRWPEIVILESERRRNWIQAPRLDRALRPLIGKTVYVGVWYDE